MTAKHAAEAPYRRAKGELRSYVVENGCFSRDENLRIFEKWFKDAPRYLFRAVARRYPLTEGVLCDVGCSYGMNLLFCSPGSYGIDIDPEQIAFARSLGLTAYQLDFVEDDIQHLPKADAVWCSAVLEHVASPHICLRKIHVVLKPGGVLGLYVPTIPRLKGLGLSRIPRLGKYFTGQDAADHINAFTPRTLAFFCERAGFETLEVSPFYPGPLSLLNRIPPFSEMVAGCVYVGRAIPQWEYHPKASREAAKNANGYLKKTFSKRLKRAECDPSPESDSSEPMPSPPEDSRAR